MSALSQLALLFFTIMISLAAYPNTESLRSTIENLTDARDEKKIIDSHQKAEVVILVSYLIGCPIFEKYVLELRKIQKAYGHKIAIIYLNSSFNAQDEKKHTLKHLQDTNNTFPLVIDGQSKIAKLLKLAISSQVAVIDLRDYTLKYRGAIDDRINLNVEKKSAKSKYLVEAIDALLAKKNIAFHETEAFGCEINFYKGK